MNENFIAVLLAAGKGTRMQTECPKVLVELKAKPLLLHVMDNLYEAGCERFIIVLGYRCEEVRAFVMERSKFSNCQFVYQKQQLGTGHAVLCTQELLQSYNGSFLVAAGDMPMLSSQSFQKLFAGHKENGNTMSVLSAMVEKPQGYGRVLRDEAGQIQSIIEEKDASDQQRKICEINTGTYVFESPKIFPLLQKISTKNTQGEYYLPDLVSLSRQAGHKVESFSYVNALEAQGINSLTELQELEELLDKRTSQDFIRQATTPTYS